MKAGFGLGILALAGAPANAATVTIGGTIVNLCTLTPTGGSMVVDSAGTTMTTESGVGALPASLAVIATGSAPTLTFSAPTLTGPVSGATTRIRYSGAGANQTYTSGGSTASASLVDVFTIHAQVQSATGFPSGSYAVTTIVTCGQS
ncbi:hypothetical protein K3174_13545 [Qipengyuania sp. 6D47A]|uniref:Spore coat protein U domain-containing protein n=1 Tax=Qipengyuania qiaonensis TaxID=2867240 RepID=A0ABS7JCI6_9SPHN|nr:hypothetical protein [Qipengyuania qiaonensis]